jgi:CheY-like chemotaxis protein
LTLAALEQYNLANEVQVVNDGSDALDYLYQRGSFAGRSDNQPIVILLDLKMPKVDGISVLREIKAHESLKRIPVVVLTSSREERDLDACYELGVNAYVVKPVKFAAFMDAVQKIGIFWAMINEPPFGEKPRLSQQA